MRQFLDSFGITTKMWNCREDDHLDESANLDQYEVDRPVKGMICCEKSAIRKKKARAISYAVRIAFEWSNSVMVSIEKEMICFKRSELNKKLIYSTFCRGFGIIDG